MSASSTRPVHGSYPGFHSQDGLYFTRTREGAVHVRVGDFETILPASSWASVVASVSGEGETGETYRAAFAFHGRPRPEYEAEVAEALNGL